MNYQCLAKYHRHDGTWYIQHPVQNPLVQIHFLVACCGRCKRLCNCQPHTSTHRRTSKLNDDFFPLAIFSVLFLVLLVLNTQIDGPASRVESIKTELHDAVNSEQWVNNSIRYIYTRESDLRANNFRIIKLIRTIVSPTSDHRLRTPKSVAMHRPSRFHWELDVVHWSNYLHSFTASLGFDSTRWRLRSKPAIRM